MPHAMRRTGDAIPTRTALLQSAGELFAGSGFQGVTAREVARRAGVALSTIPYHFGSMENLYREVLLLACEVAPDARPLAEQARRAAPEEALRIAVRWAIADLAGQADAWAVLLLERETLDPSPAFRDIVDRKYLPEWRWLCDVVARAAGRREVDDAVRFAVLTMHTLVSTFLTRRRFLEQLAPGVLEGAADVDAFTETLAHLTLDAVERYAPPGAARRPASGRRTSR